MVSALRLTRFPEDAVVIFTVVAPVLVSVIFFELYAPATVAVAVRRTYTVPLTEPLV